MPKTEVRPFEKARHLARNGYYIGPRDPKRNKAFDGSWMVCEQVDAGPTDDAGTGGYCIVGDDLNDLISVAYFDIL